MKRLIFTLIFTTLTIFLLTACGHTHEFREWKIKTDSTCSAEGERIRSCACGEIESETILKKSHSITVIAPVAPTCTESGTSAGTYCTVCAKYIEAPVTVAPRHNYSPSQLTVPSCISMGANLYTCTACNASYTEVLSSLGYNYSNASCSAPRTCKNCSAIDGKSLGHTTAMGKCSRCNTYINPTVTLPQLPLLTANDISYKKTVLKITELYRFYPPHFK